MACCLSLDGQHWVLPKALLALSTTQKEAALSMGKARKTEVWEGNDEEIRRLFTLTPDDLHFLQPLRVDTQRLYRALVLVWARVERVLLSDTASIPEGVIAHVCKQLGLSPTILSHLRHHPSMRAATFEAVRTHL